MNSLDVKVLLNLRSRRSIVKALKAEIVEAGYKPLRVSRTTCIGYWTSDFSYHSDQAGIDKNISEMNPKVIKEIMDISERLYSYLPMRMTQPEYIKICLRDLIKQKEISDLIYDYEYNQGGSFKYISSVYDLLNTLEDAGVI